MRVVNPCLEVYLRQVNADPDRAWALILWERRVAAALWTDIAHCEVIVRNAIHRSLQTQAGSSDWHDRLPQLGIRGADRARVADVVQRLHDAHRPVTVDGVTAALSLTFWTNLVGPSYDRTLWRNGLAASFSRAPRREVHAAMERVKALRNAIAHHAALIKDNRTESSEERLRRGLTAAHGLIRRTTPAALADLVCSGDTAAVIAQRP